MYADKITKSMQKTIDETNRRREKQFFYNEEMGITPRQIVKASKSIMGDITGKKAGEKFYAGPQTKDIAADPIVKYMNEEALKKAIEKTRKNMEKAAEELDFAKAAGFRNEMYELEKMLEAK